MAQPPGHGMPRRLAERAITLWALAGGAVLLGLVAVNVGAVAAAALGRPFAGDFELTEMGAAVAVFAFLPYCQLTDANARADIFMSRMPVRVRAALGLVASLAALLFALVLFWRMQAGLLDQYRDHYTTAILQVPHWIAFVPILVSLVLLAVASALTLADDVRRVRSTAAR